MHLLPLLSLAPGAFANPVDGGLQLAVFVPGIDYATDWVEGEEYRVDLDEVGAAFECYDKVGIRDFNLNFPIEEVRVGLEANVIHVEVEFGTIHGEDMKVFGDDENWWDWCVSFETDLHELRIENAVASATLFPWVELGELRLGLDGLPSLSGDLHADINNLPDSLVLGIVEDMIWDKLTEMAGAMLPELASSYWNQDLLSGEVYDFAFEANLEDSTIRAGALELGATVTTAWTAPSQCLSPLTPSSVPGRRPEISFGSGEGSSLAVGITEAQLNGAFVSLWEDGFLCFGQERMDELFEQASSLFRPEVGGITVEASFLEAPQVAIQEEGALVRFTGLELTVMAGENGEQELLDAQLNVRANLDLGVEPALTALTLSLHDLSVHVEHVYSQQLLADEDSAEDHMNEFLSGWLAGWLEDQLTDLVLLNTQFEVYDTFIRVDRIAYQAGGMAVFISLYHDDDPRVDRTAPESEVWLERTDGEEGAATVGWGGSDDREGGLAYVWRADGAGWSRWTTDTRVELTGLGTGWHTLEVLARDGWLNEEHEASFLEFEVPPPSAAIGRKITTCACNGSGGRPALLWIALTLLPLWVRRQDTETT